MFFPIAPSWWSQLCWWYMSRSLGWHRLAMWVTVSDGVLWNWTQSSALLHHRVVKSSVLETGSCLGAAVDGSCIKYILTTCIKWDFVPVSAETLKRKFLHIYEKSLLPGAKTQRRSSWHSHHCSAYLECYCWGLSFGREWLLSPCKCSAMSLSGHAFCLEEPGNSSGHGRGWHLPEEVFSSHMMLGSMWLDWLSCDAGGKETFSAASGKKHAGLVMLQVALN